MAYAGAVPVEAAALIAVALTVVGVCGIVVPVWPGTITVLAGLLVWACFSPAPWGWIVFGVGALLLAAGASRSTSSPDAASASGRSPTGRCSSASRAG